MHKLHG